MTERGVGECPWAAGRRWLGRGVGPGAALVLVLGLIACGSDDTVWGGAGGSGAATQGGGGAGGDGGTGGSGGDGGTAGSGGNATGGSTASGGGTTGGGGVGGAGGGVSGCDRSGLTTVSQGAATFGGLSGVLGYNGYSAPQQSGDLLDVELWFQYGASSVPHTFSFSGENYLDCHTCAVLMTECVDGTCGRRFLVQSGTLDVTTIDAVNGVFAGTLQNATAIEVTIDPSTAVSTPVAGGETWCLDSVDMSADITALPGGITKP